MFLGNKKCRIYAACGVSQTPIYGKMRGTDVIIETLRLRKNVTVQYLHSYESKSIENRLRRWDFDLYVSGFWHFHAKTPRGIVDF